ncbi:hypothetical protein J4G37_43000, partial [Microvirga sp. 3-52]|nr:hypothetical protein [Microvirga sp. 3-52]
SVGQSGNKERTLVSKMEIGADNAPEILKYAIGTNIDPKDGLQDGEGNLLLHGGVHVQGDMKVDGNIISRNKGYAYLNGEKWIDSLYPSTKPTPGAETARLVLGKKAYTFNSNLGYSSHISRNDFNSNRNYSNQTNNINALFRTGFAPVVVTRNPVRSPIGISDKQSVYKYVRSGAAHVIKTNSSRVITSADFPNLKVFPSYA